MIMAMLTGIVIVHAESKGTEQEGRGKISPAKECVRQGRHCSHQEEDHDALCQRHQA